MTFSKYPMTYGQIGFTIFDRNFAGRLGLFRNVEVIKNFVFFTNSVLQFLARVSVGKLFEGMPVT